MTNKNEFFILILKMGAWTKGTGLRFDKLYQEKGGIKILLGMYQNGCTYEKIGEYFGISRQRIEQILKKLSPPIPNRIVYPSLIEEKKRTNPNILIRFSKASKSSAWFKGKLGEVIFYNLTKSNYNGTRSTNDFNLNGLKIDVKICLTKWFPKNSRKGYWKFRTNDKQRTIVDFFFIIAGMDHYLIPASAIKKNDNYISLGFRKYKITEERKNVLLSR